MTQFMRPSFSVHVGGKAYSDGWDRIFGKKEEKKPPGPSDCTFSGCIGCEKCEEPHPCKECGKHIPWNWTCYLGPGGPKHATCYRREQK